MSLIGETSQGCCTIGVVSRAKGVVFLLSWSPSLGYRVFFCGFSLPFRISRIVHDLVFLHSAAWRWYKRVLTNRYLGR